MCSHEVQFIPIHYGQECELDLLQPSWKHSQCKNAPGTLCLSASEGKGKVIGIFPGICLFLPFILANTPLLACSPVAQVLDVSEVNDFAFSLYDRGVASHINKS